MLNVCYLHLLILMLYVDDSDNNKFLANTYLHRHMNVCHSLDLSKTSNILFIRLLIAPQLTIY